MNRTSHIGVVAGIPCYFLFCILALAVDEPCRRNFSALNPSSLERLVF